MGLSILSSLLLIASPLPTPTALPVYIVNDERPDVLNYCIGIVAAVASVVAAVYAYRGFQAQTAKPVLDYAITHAAVAIASTDDCEYDVGVVIHNSGATTDGVYVDLWLAREAPYPVMSVDPSANTQWMKRDDEISYDKGRRVTIWRWTRYYAQHLPQNQTTELQPFHVRVEPVNAEYHLYWRLTSADGSGFPAGAPRGLITIQVLIAG